MCRVYFIFFSSVYIHVLWLDFDLRDKPYRNIFLIIYVCESLFLYSFFHFSYYFILFFIFCRYVHTRLRNGKIHHTKSENVLNQHYRKTLSKYKINWNRVIYFHLCTQSNHYCNRYWDIEIPFHCHLQTCSK